MKRTKSKPKKTDPVKELYDRLHLEYRHEAYKERSRAVDYLLHSITHAYHEHEVLLKYKDELRISLTDFLDSKIENDVNERVKNNVAWLIRGLEQQDK